MGERSMRYIYGVQWIDYGGPYEEPAWEDQVPTALEQMGLDPNTVIEEIGGFKLNNQPGSSGLFGFIETNVPLPKWGGMVKGSTRWVEDIQLWFYTFSVNEGNIVKQWTVQEFEEEIYQ